MTVREYIAELQKLPKDARVVINGYEGGSHNASGPRLGHLVQNVHPNDRFMGPHEFYRDAEDAIEEAIYVGAGESALCQAVNLQ